MSVLSQDLLYALRHFRKHRSTAITAVITLALGIGVTTAIFSVFNAVVLNPLPYANSNRLIWLTNYLPKLKDHIVGTPDFIAWRDQNHTLDGIAAFDDGDFNLTSTNRAERIHYAAVTSSLFDVLGVQPALGRPFRSQENTPVAAPVVIISSALWHRRFGGAQSAIGSKIELDYHPYEIVGIMAPTFVFPASGSTPDVLLPLTVPGRADTAIQTIEVVNVIGRLRKGISISQASAEIASIQRQFIEQSYQVGFKNMVSGLQTQIVPLQQHLIGNFRHSVAIMMAAVMFLLLSACANNTNLQLAQAAARMNEFGIRSALGAKKSRLVRQLITENVLLSSSAGILGIVVAASSIAILNRWHPPSLPHFSPIVVNDQVIEFALILVALSGLFSGLLPALLANTENLAERLKQGSHSLIDSRSSGWVRRLLVMAEIALAMVLLVGSALFIRSFVALMQVNPGFEVHDLLTLQISLPDAKYSDANRQRNFFNEVGSKLSNLPGVSGCAAVSDLPLAGDGWSAGIEFQGEEVPQGMRPFVGIVSTSAGYFRVMHIPLLGGRYFTDTDTPHSPDVAIVNQEFAQHFFGNTHVLGKKLRVGSSTEWITIVGVIANIHNVGLQNSPTPELFTLFEQHPRGQMAVVLRTVVNPDGLVATIRNAIASVDLDQPIFDVSSMEERMAASITSLRVNMWLLAAFGGTALLLSITGIYAVVSFYVANRTYEIGLRIALGADRRDIVHIVLKLAAMLALSGIGIGLGASLMLTPFLSNLLFDIRPSDFPSFVGACVIVASAAGLASYVPAQRAAKIDPLVAIRYE